MRFERIARHDSKVSTTVIGLRTFRARQTDRITGARGRDGSIALKRSLLKSSREYRSFCGRFPAARPSSNDLFFACGVRIIGCARARVCVRRYISSCCFSEKQSVPCRFGCDVHAAGHRNARSGICRNDDCERVYFARFYGAEKGSNFASCTYTGNPTFSGRFNFFTVRVIQTIRFTRISAFRGEIRKETSIYYTLAGLKRF